MRGLRALTTSCSQGLRDWATCIATLFSAVVKLSFLRPINELGELIAVVTVWRGVSESRLELPRQFYEKMPENQNYPGALAHRVARSGASHPPCAMALAGGSEPAFMSTTGTYAVGRDFATQDGVGTVLEMT